MEAESRLKEYENVTKDEITIVSAIKNKLADEIGPDKFDIWFDRSVSWNLTGSTLCLCAPNSFSAERLKRVYQPKLREILLHLSQNHLDLSFKVATKQETAPPKTELKPEPTFPHVQEISLTPAKQSFPTHRPDAGLLNLITGQSNHLAVSAAKSMLARPGTISPLFIHGPSGSGKSHLLQSIWNKFRGRVKRAVPCI